jgi:hypothetical protein
MSRGRGARLGRGSRRKRASDLEGPGVTTTDALTAIGGALPAIEIRGVSGPAGDPTGATPPDAGHDGDDHSESRKWAASSVRELTPSLA